MIEPIIQPVNQEYLDLIKIILNTNEKIIHQNAMVLQSLTLPALLVKAKEQT